ncbi:hypothetical protein EHEL_030900 [Encephalitozoon hellem ATCC 50504]|uniref:EF-hand domain-containing protein n=1 Tax=Encephalitozoon hellem TaxID=27973 RepID=A0A9Q9C2C1_ENCHE|nr:uncharacterized protein EHEL_030900 [Encephalitozoon hellem ATCC 50504]AFM97987.1 hypothetical protein EHEL_030900 [Encephalitozoon hellem ATCC 50504]UTX42791.1 hypothetical protein GPU96_03g05130 [Encephalitozoon hellem]|eukprot:XP_003886968.1 hypothetical protein EHEL_030900 [Encephalitozoon hellem ATCC 50504]
MQAKRIDDMQQIEESDFFVEKKSGIDSRSNDPSPPSAIWIVFYFLGSLISGMLAYMTYYSLILPKLKSNENNHLSVVSERLLMCFLIGAMIWFALELALTYLSITLKKVEEKQGFLQSTLIKNGWFISLVLTLLALSFIIGSYSRGIEIMSVESAGGAEEGTPQVSGEDASADTSDQSKPKPSTKPETFIMDKISRILLAGSIFLGIILTKTIFMDKVNYKMLFENYEDRIYMNYEDMKMLEQLNRITGKRMDLEQDVELWANSVFKTISPEKDAVDIQTLEYFFGTDYAQKIFERFDIYGDGRLTGSSFALVYRDILNEEKRITMGMAQKVTIVEKLDIVLSFILIPFGVAAATPIVENEINLVNLLPIQFGTLFSLHVIFASTLGDMFKSLVFIFLVKPFDVGDKILIDGKLHKVYDMGLLYTSFVVEKKVTVIPNTKIMDKTIVNLRKARTSQKQFEFTFTNAPEFKEKAERLNAAIEKEVKSDPNVYTGKFSVYGYNLKRNSSIGIKIDAVFWIQNQDIKALRTREDAFVIALHDIFKDLGLVLE